MTASNLIQKLIQKYGASLGKANTAPASRNELILFKEEFNTCTLLTITSLAVDYALLTKVKNFLKENGLRVIIDQTEKYHGQAFIHLGVAFKKEVCKST